MNQKLALLKRQQDAGTLLDRLNAVRVTGSAAAKARRDRTAEVRINRICDDVEWLNGLSNPIGESYHPNQLGHDTFTDLIAARL